MIIDFRSNIDGFPESLGRNAKPAELRGIPGSCTGAKELRELADVGFVKFLIIFITEF